MSWRIINADCIEAMAEMDEASIDAIVTDPPYGLGFMGREWDSLPPGDEFAAEALRVLKPGGHLLAFGGTRTYHRLTCAIEDAGFEIRDCLAWLYGSGFPKSLDVSKAIDKAAGAERTERVKPKAGHENFVGRDNMKSLREGTMSQDGGFKRPWMSDPEAVERAHWDYATATDEAEAWQGWGTALKPAHEPIVLARKPLTGTVAGNVLEFGTGALNVDGCRVEGAPPSVPQPDFKQVNGRATHLDANARNGEMSQASGRWPANVTLSHHPDCEEVGVRKVKASAPASGPTHTGPSTRGAMAGDFKGMGDRDPANYADPDGTETIPAFNCHPDCPIRLLDEQSGERVAGWKNTDTAASVGGVYGDDKRDRTGPHYADTGGASRFFYCAKTSRTERNAGLEGFEEKPSGVMQDDAYKWERDGKGNAINLDTRKANTHPTVKPIALMTWLCRLVTPPGGTVLDPFNGSGTTGIAAVLEDFDYIGIEREAEYVAIAEARIKWWANQPRQMDLLGEVA